MGLRPGPNRSTREDLKEKIISRKPKGNEAGQRNTKQNTWWERRPLSSQRWFVFLTEQWASRDLCACLHKDTKRNKKIKMKHLSVQTTTDVKWNPLAISMVTTKPTVQRLCLCVCWGGSGGGGGWQPVWVQKTEHETMRQRLHPHYSAVFLVFFLSWKRSFTTVCLSFTIAWWLWAAETKTCQNIS